MTQDEYVLLYEKYLSGKCTLQEEELIYEVEDDFALIDLPWQESGMGKKEDTKQDIFAELEKSRRRSIQPAKKHFPWVSVAAAVVLLLMSAGTYIWFKSDRERTLSQIETAIRNADIAPGKEKAMLTLADGSVLVLDDLANGKLSRQGQASIIKADGQITYDATVDPGAEVRYNTISTPRGGQYQVVLPDGTKVWLNAASSLRFQTAFAGKERNVELTGEAYFEVAKNKEMPFKVTVQSMQVEVLGTHFNVMAYGDENSVKTTLLEGAVKIHYAQKSAVLEPGQQAVFQKSADNIAVSAANTGEAVAWKNGYFVFDNESIQSIMRKVSRWYNVEVVYQGDMTGKDFVGTVSRSGNVSEVLNTLELTGTIRFKVEGRRITVMP